MLDLEKYKRNLISALKLNGITIRSEFSSFIIESLHNSKINLNNEFENCVKIVCEYLEKHTDVGRSIEKSHIEKAVEACIQSGIDDHETTFNVINAFDFPKLYFDLSRKLYFLDTKNRSVLFSNPENKSELFANRYRNVLQRTQRSLTHKNELLETNKITLHTVDYLLTVSQRTLENNLILGSLFHGANGKYFIEDPTGMIELDLKHAKYHGGFFYENCFVLVNGYYSDKMLQVSTMILPPGEEFENSRAAFGSLNYFGGQSESLLRDSKKLSDVMHRNSGGMMVFISDLWLDKPIVFEKLQVLFEGLAEMPPIAFVFIGNFLSQCYAAETLDILNKSFKQLAELIKQFHNIKEYSHFVFVPGLNDPCMMHIVPRMALPKLLTDNFKKQIPKTTFTTNPCRIQYCTREIIIYRSDMLSKFMQESLNKPNKDKINDFITKTIVSQGHLSPFSINVQPVHWSFDYTLHLYPLPNLVVIGDKCNPYAGSYKGCSVVNPGSFIESGFAFKTYIPASDTVDDCGL